MITFDFCGFNSYTDLSLIVNDIHRYISPTINENLQEVPGMYGNIFQGNSYGERQFDIDVTIIADTEEDRAEKLHQLTDLFVQTGVGEFPIVFSDDSSVTYYGHWQNLPNPQRAGDRDTNESVTLTFMCSDPYAYLPQETINIAENPTTITPLGTATCFPIFTCMPHSDITHIAVSNDSGDYVYLGSDVADTGATPADNEPVVLRDTCNTLANWTKIDDQTITYELENGKIGGDMRSTTNTIRPALDSDGHQNFGSHVTGYWYGPTRKQMLSSAYDDYRVYCRMGNYQYYPRARTKIDLYLLNQDGERIGMIEIKDNTLGEYPIIFIQVGSHNEHHSLYDTYGKVNSKGKQHEIKLKVKDGTKTVTVKGKKKTVTKWKTLNLDEDIGVGAYKNFFGSLELRKVGNKFSCKISKLDTKTHAQLWNNPIEVTWTDTANKYSSNKLAGIAIYMAKWGIYQDDHGIIYRNNDVFISHLQVNNIINGGNGATPHVIAGDGDEIKIDSETHTVLKNGSTWMNELAIGSNFPKMVGGIPSSFGFDPDITDADWSIDYLPTRK